jgi:hypothetical protein
LIVNYRALEILAHMIGTPTRPSGVRLIAGYGAVASALPYLALKMIWLAGGSVGVADRSVIHEPSMIVLNAITAGMDVVGILLALAFTHGWGSRIPAWLLLPPIWVATGLLARFVVAVPIVALLSALTPRSMPAIAGGLVEPWVYVLVYVEFAGLGIGLMVAFLFYARTRWADVFSSPVVAASRRERWHRVLVAVANASATAAVALGGLYLAWAFGATAGLADGAATRRTVIGSIINGIDALLILSAAAGVLMLVHRIGAALPAWLPVSMAWIGTGSLFGWGLWQTINVLGQTALMRGAEGRAFVNLVGMLNLVVGLVMGLLLVFVFADRQRPASRRE